MYVRNANPKNRIVRMRLMFVRREGIESCREAVAFFANMFATTLKTTPIPRRMYGSM